MFGKGFTIRIVTIWKFISGPTLLVHVHSTFYDLSGFPHLGLVLSLEGSLCFLLNSPVSFYLCSSYHNSNTPISRMFLKALQILQPIRLKDITFHRNCKIVEDHPKNLSVLYNSMNIRCILSFHGQSPSSPTLCTLLEFDYSLMHPFCSVMSASFFPTALT